jgi:aryl-alcohol dehydrogenase-like predicted oxidoreductase
VEYVAFGKTGIRVSKLCMGTMTFGKEADEKTSIALMNRAREAGINFFDTANVYSRGLSEEIVGRWLADKRESIVLASKAHGAMGDGPNDWGSSRRNIILAVEHSLKRLKTEWLDILYLHLWDDQADLEQSLAAVTTLIEQGKVMYCGVSNFAAWQTMKAIAITESKPASSPCTTS